MEPSTHSRLEHSAGHSHPCCWCGGLFRLSVDGVSLRGKSPPTTRRFQCGRGVCPQCARLRMGHVWHVVALYRPCLREHTRLISITYVILDDASPCQRPRCVCSHGPSAWSSKVHTTCGNDHCLDSLYDGNSHLCNSTGGSDLLGTDIRVDCGCMQTFSRCHYHPVLLSSHLRASGYANIVN